MTFFGLTDPYIVGMYVGCILCVILCCGWAIMKREKMNEEDGEK